MLKAEEVEGLEKQIILELKKGKSTITELAEALKINKGTISKIIDRLRVQEIIADKVELSNIKKHEITLNTNKVKIERAFAKYNQDYIYLSVLLSISAITCYFLKDLYFLLGSVLIITGIIIKIIYLLIRHKDSIIVSKFIEEKILETTNI